MKKYFALFIFSLFLYESTNAQCNDDNTFNGTTVNVGCPGSTSAALSAGEYLNVNVTAGNIYTFSTCGSNTCDTYLTLADLGTLTAYAFNDDGGTSVGGCSEIVWLSNVNGTLSLLLDRYINPANNCGNTGCNGTTVTISCSQPPTNTEPCGAVTLTPTAACNYQTYDNTNVGAGYEFLPGCANYVNNDLWFTFTVGATGGANIDLQAQGMTDSGMEIFTGTDCSNLTSQACDDDGGNGGMSNLDANFPPGTQVWVRVWGYDDDQGTFGICVTETVPTTTASDCSTAINICTNAGFTIDPNGVGIVNDVPAAGSVGNPYYNGVFEPDNPWASGNAGCLRDGEKNSTWMLVTVEQPGNLEVTFGVGTQAGFYDWIMWPYDGNSCADISAGNVAPVRCNWNGANTGGTGMVTNIPAGGNATNYEPALAVGCQEQYLICFSNYDSQSSTVPVEFSGTAQVSCDGLPTLNVTDISICPGETGTLNISGADSYTWSPATGLNTTTGNSVEASPTISTTYTVTGTVGCITVDTTVDVTINPLPSLSTSYVDPNGGGTVNANNITVCPNTSFQLNGIGSNDPFTWFPATGLSCTNCDNPTVTVNDTSITYYGIGNSPDNCNDTVTFTVNVQEPTITSFNVTAETCDGLNDGTASPNVTGGSPGYTFSWNTTPVQGTQIANDLEPGTTYTVTVTDQNGCVVTGDTTVPAGLVIDAGFTQPTAQCLTGNNFTFTNTGTTGVTYSWDFGDTGTSAGENPAHGYASDGTYTVTQIVSSGTCADTASLDVVVHPMPTIAVVSDSVNCNGASDGEVTVTNVTTSPGTFPGNYNYSWDSAPVQNSQTATGLPAGTYTVTVQDLTTTCTSTESVELYEPTVVSGSTSTNNPSCSQGSDGDATVTPNGGTPPYTYSWNTTPVQNTQTATGLSDGTYTVTIYDAYGCNVDVNAVVTDPAGIVSNTSITQSNCGQSDGSATVNVVSGGSGNFSYSWNTAPVQNTQSATNIPAGSYIVTITDNTLGCNAYDTALVTTTAGILANTFLVNDALCNGVDDGVAYATVSGGNPGYTYSWDDLATTQNDTLTAGAGTYSVTITDTNNCTATANITIGEPSPVDASILSSNDESCFGANNGSATGNGIQGTGGYTYSWNTTPVQTSQTATNLPPGNYTVYVYDDNLCVDSATVTINPGPSMTSSLTATNIICFGANNGAIDATIGNAPGAINYTWTPSGSASEDPIGLTPGMHYVTATSNGCTVSDSIEIFEPTELIVTLDSTTDVTCNGANNGEAFTTVSGGTTPYTISWNDPGTSTTDDINGLANGTYTISISDSNNCTASTSATINEPVALTALTGGSNSYCSLPTGEVWISPQNGTAPYSFEWDSAGTVIGSADTIRFLYAGTYNVELTDSNGCVFNSSVTINNDPKGTASIDSQSNVSCNNGSDGSATALVNSIYPPFSYQWDDPSSQTSNPATGLSSGVYNVQITDSLGCVMITNVNITEPFPISIMLTGTDPSCFQGCDGQIASEVNGGTAPYSYLWNDPANQTNDTAFNLCEGEYFVTVTDDKNCAKQDTLKITSPLQMQSSSNVIAANCNQADGSAYVNVTANGNAPYTYQWTDGATILGTDSLLDNVFAGTYYVSITDANNCSITDTVTIPNSSGPVIDSTTQVNVLCFGNSTGEAEVYVSGGQLPYTYLWDDLAGQTTPNATNLIAGGYTITVTDSNGCTVSAPVNIIEPTELIISAFGTDPSCTGYNDGMAWVEYNGGVGPYTFNWNSTPVQTTDTATDLLAQAGGYTVTVTDSNGCFKTENVVITNPPLFTVDVTKTDVSCFNGSNGTATVTENNGVSPFQYLWNDPNTQTTQTAVGLTANTYNVIVTDSMGCVANGQAIIDEPNDLTITLDTTGHVTCNGFSDGFIGITANGGSGAYDYSWEYGGNVISVLQNPNGLIAGQYTLTVTDTAGCDEQLVVNINQPDPLNAVVSTEDARCFGEDSGEAIANVSGGTLPYTFQWNDINLQQTDTAFNLLAGSYNVDISDSNGCMFNVTDIIIDEPDQIVLNTTTTNSTCGDDNGSATVTVGGGVDPYNYLWSDPNSQSTAVATDLFAGSYTIYVTDFNGCVDSTTADVVDQGSPSVTIPTSTDVSCNGAADGTATADVTGGTAPYQYAWTNGDVGMTATGLSGQTYSITVTDDNGCTASASIVIDEAAGLVTSITNSTNVSCFGVNDGSAIAIANGGNGTNYNFSWNTNPVQNLDTASNLAAGTYVVTVTDDNNCLAYDTITITEPPLLTLTLDSLKNISCFGYSDGYINVEVNGGTLPYTNFNWTPNVSNGPTANQLSFGTYHLTVTDFNNCTVSDSFNITEPDDIVLTTASTPETCGQFNGSAEVSNVTGGTQPYSYSWNDPNNQTSNIATNLGEGGYTVTVTDLNNCQTSELVNVDNLEGPTVDSLIITPPLCNGENTGSVEVFASGNNPLSYFWTPTSQTANVASGLSAGVYSVVITDANSCTWNEGGIIVTEPTPLTANITVPATACYGESITLYGNGGGGTPFGTPNPAYVVIWLAPFNTTGQGPFVDTLYSNFTYNIVVQDANGCVKSASESVAVGQPLNIAATGDEICITDTAIVQAAASGGMFGATYDYTWLEYDSLTGNTITPFGVTNPTSVNGTQLYPYQTTDYIVYVSDGCSMNDTAAFTVVVNDSSIVTINTTEGGCPYPYWGVGLEVIGDTLNSSFTWDFDGDGVFDQTTTSDSIGHNYVISGLYDVNLMVETEKGCISNFHFPQEVEIFEIPIADFEPDPDQTTELDPTIEFNDLSTPDVQHWYWDFGDMVFDTLNQNPIHTYPDTGTYQVQLIVDNGNCLDTITKYVQIKPDFLFLIPNTFTPQGDGINDIFMPGTMIGISPEDYNFYIYNRWGEVIWEGHDLNDGWDGTAKGGSEIVQDGTYVWLIKLKGNDGLIREYRGHVNVLK